MKILQVKMYNEEIARVKQEAALDRWKVKDNGYGYPVKSMFFFLLSDSKGYPQGERQKGYVAFDERKSCFGMNEKEAIQSFQSQ